MLKKKHNFHASLSDCFWPAVAGHERLESAVDSTVPALIRIMVTSTNLLSQWLECAAGQA